VRLVDGGVVPVKQLPAAISSYVNGLGVGAQAEFATQHVIEAQQGSPVKTGRFLASWTGSVGSERFRGLGRGGQSFPVVTRAQLDAIFSQLDGKKPAYVTNDAHDYAWVIDRGRMPYVTRRGMGGSEQARLGVSNPAAFRAQRATEAARARIERRAAT
jgi:hypothetical protein